jgi:hypothetical protein
LNEDDHTIFFEMVASGSLGVSPTIDAGVVAIPEPPIFLSEVLVETTAARIGIDREVSHAKYAVADSVSTIKARNAIRMRQRLFSFSAVSVKFA